MTKSLSPCGGPCGGSQLTARTLLSQEHSPMPPARLIPLDALRGWIMIAMAIDHASLLVARVHSGELWGTALPDHPDAWWLLTRWITHLCAPGFFFLMGAGIALLAVTLGVNLVALWLLAATSRPRDERNPALVFGRSALFFYLAHLYL